MLNKEQSELVLNSCVRNPLTIEIPFDEEPSTMLRDSNCDVHWRIRIPDSGLCFFESIDTQRTFKTETGTVSSSTIQ